MSDWVFHGLAGLLAVVGLLVLALALFRDRSRGRRRCPKCWYDLAGSGDDNRRCSECGSVARTERKLHKTRRHWRWAMVGVALLIGAHAARVTPNIQQNGWWAAVPTTAIIVISPWLDPMESTLIDEMTRRANDDELATWQWEWFFSWGLKNGDRILEPRITTRSRWVRGEPLMAKVSADFHARASSGSIVASPVAPDANSIGYSWHPIAEGMYGPNDLQNAGAFGIEMITDWDVEVSTTFAGRRVTWTKRVNAPVRFLQSSRFIVDPARDWLVYALVEEELRASIHDHDLHLSLDRFESQLRSRIIESVFSNVTFAVDVELLHCGEVVARGQAWCGSDSRHRCSGFVVPNILPEIPPQLMTELIGNRHKWSVRVQSNRNLAMHDLESQLYWSGSLTVPLDEVHISRYD